MRTGSRLNSTFHILHVLTLFSPTELLQLLHSATFRQPKAAFYVCGVSQTENSKALVALAAPWQCRETCTIQGDAELSAAFASDLFPMHPRLTCLAHSRRHPF